MASNISSDLIWECTRGQSAFLCKRKSAGGMQFSRDPLNLVNKHSRKYDGFLSDKAIGINSSDKSIILTTKKANKANKPASMLQTSTFKATTPARNLYRSIVNSTAKKGYRADLRAEAVSRASAIKRSQRPVKADRVPKLRGVKARKEKEVSSE
ncbi:hypothetical protein H2201_004854 [Coniosporium apollinis]|uniref:Ribosomal eL28/Mak16 domain-containing protein n=2 Tax=Coniosporium TaxID=2810619 RepID=A0ABQ9NUK1_9PEZI|nr:hypothetical protein H2199_004572 [Cladosporium sp. JES 115]KAJ9664990.1 hypothetical protein H2201_004854 [Coniosporium apollinis]